MRTILDSLSGEGLCAQVDPRIFFPDENNKAIGNPKRVCAACFQREECLDWALANPDLAEHGTWGGLGPAQRRHEAARRKQRRS